MNLHFIAGFLGQPSDWALFKEDFIPNHSLYHSIEDFLPQDTLLSDDLFYVWARNFNQYIFKEKMNQNQKNILIGYSLGGRLALHCLNIKNYWDAAIIISANPGLQNENEKKIRILNDNKWAQRFLNDPWEIVMNDWNSQGVFSSQKNNLSRLEKNYSRNNIVNILNGFSLGKQSNLRPMLSKLKIPLLWISGELDTKFSLITNELLNLNISIKGVIIPGAGHRVPWESQREFTKLCLNFLGDI